MDDDRESEHLYDSEDDDVSIYFDDDLFEADPVAGLPSWAVTHPPVFSISGQKPGEPAETPSTLEDNADELTSSSVRAIYGTTAVLHASALDAQGPSFRLLQIFPGRPGEVMSCKLITRRLYDAPPYLALSYAWGSQSASTQININGEPFYISEHLDDALSMLQSREGVVHVWVDVICINQQNLIEKCSQIQIMAQIFNGASEVRVWLGTSPLIVDFDNLAPQEIAEMLLQHVLPWWKRLWIVQECVYAKQCPIVMIGNTTMSLIAFREALRMIPQHLDVELRRYFNSQVMDYIALPLDMWTSRLQSRTLSLVQAIRQTKTRQYTIPHDRVYAVLSLIHEDEARRIVPDYRKPYWKLKAEVDQMFLSTAQDGYHENEQLLALDSLTNPQKVSLQADLGTAVREGDLEAVRAILSTPKVCTAKAQGPVLYTYLESARLDLAFLHHFVQGVNKTSIVNLLRSYGPLTAKTGIYPDLQVNELRLHGQQMGPFDFETALSTRLPTLRG